MNTNERLKVCEQRLRDAGVVDVKFFFRRANKTLSGVANEVAEVVEAMLDGRYTRAKPLGDSVRGA